LGLGQPGNWRVVRGGSWNNNQNNARAAFRNHNHPDNRNNNNGFRVVGVRRSTPYLFSKGSRTLPLRKGVCWPREPGSRRTISCCFQLMLAD
jgi:hypothetical protein